MTLTIDLTPTEQERVMVAAQQNGLEPAEFVKKLVTDSLPFVTNGASATPQTTIVEEKIRAMDAFTEKNRSLPILTDEAFDCSNNGGNARQERDPELVARVKAIRGKYAHTAKESGTEELHRERQRDKVKEEVQIRGYQP